MASTVLVRGVVFDGLRVDHPAVSGLLDTLAPVAEAELAYLQDLDDRHWSRWEEEKPEFPENDGPVFLIGTCALGDATDVEPTGNRIADAHLAGLTREHGLAVVPTDSDFGKFRGAAWFKPVTGEERRCSA